MELSMAITTVTTDNLAEYAAGRKSGNASPAAEVPAGDGPTPGNPVIKDGIAETVSAAPDPGAQPKEARAPKPVQPRIDELVREKKELDEAFQTEYEQRLRLEGELTALRSQQQPKAIEQPKEDPEPQPANYTDQTQFLSEWGAWQRKQARKEFAAEQDQARKQEAFKATEAAMVTKVAKAQADLPDFEEVIEAADRRTRQDLPAHIKAAIYESDVGAHIAYYLAKDPAEEKRIFGLPIARALLELGKIETTFSKAKVETPAAETPPKPPETRTPAPITKLREGPGIVTGDLSAPMDFKAYRSQRIEQIRSSGRKRH